MNRLTMKVAMGCLCAGLMLASCDTTNNRETTIEGSGSESQSTPNDSSGAESNKAMGVGEDNQNEEPGYPSNQNNLNADSTKVKHDK